MAKSSQVTAYSLAEPEKAKEIVDRVLEHLRQPAYFRTALALYRRLQFGRFSDSSYLFTNRQWISGSDKDEADSTPWFYAFVDRGCRPETEVWLFGSWEVKAQENTKPLHPNGTASPEGESIRTLLLDLLQSIKSLLTPPSIHAAKDVLAAQSQLATSNHSPPSQEEPPTTQPPDPRVMLWGTLHAATVPHLQALGYLALHLHPLVPNHTFLFPLSTLPAPTPLPQNLRWGKLEKQHFPLVRSRTVIARQDFTLACLPNLAIFPVSTQPAEEEKESQPIAWAFVGLDGSLMSLHTEAGYRRLGLGMALTAKLFREEMELFWEEGVERVTHANVVVGNEASARMCARLGGRSEWEVSWVMVDLGA